MRRIYSLLLVVMALMTPKGAWADNLKLNSTFEVDGVTYKVTNTTNMTVSVGPGSSGQTAVSTSTTGKIVIPSTVTGTDGQTYTVTLVGKYAFDGCTGLTSVVLPNTVLQLLPYSFRGCSSLSSVTLPDALQSFDGADIFKNCISLVSITIPNTVTRIASGTFAGCSNLKSFNLPESLINLESGAFTGTAWYEEQPDGPIYKDNVFFEYKGRGIEGELKINEGTRLIAGGACYNCTKMISVVIPNTVEHIGKRAFYSCSSLKSVNIPNSVCSILNYAFESCI